MGEPNSLKNCLPKQAKNKSINDLANTINQFNLIKKYIDLCTQLRENINSL